MAASRKSVYVEAELQWAEEQLLSWKAYVDANPLHELKDRLSYKETKSGGLIPMVVASIEQQGKFVQDTMKNYLSLLKEVELMRSQEEAKKIASRGDKEVSLFEDGTL